MPEQLQRKIPDLLPMMTSQAGARYLYHGSSPDPLHENGRVFHQLIVSFGVGQNSADSLTLIDQKNLSRLANDLDGHFDQSNFPIVIDGQQLS